MKNHFIEMELILYGVVCTHIHMPMEKFFRKGTEWHSKKRKKRFGAGKKDHELSNARWDSKCKGRKRIQQVDCIADTFK